MHFVRKILPRNAKYALSAWVYFIQEHMLSVSQFAAIKLLHLGKRELYILWFNSLLTMFYIKNPDKLPEFYRNIAKNEGVYQGVCDYIGGMSDDYCIHLFNELYVPKFVIY